MGQYTESWLELEKATGRFVLKGSVEELRNQFNGLIEAVAPQLPPPSDAISTKDGELDGVKYRVYTPKDATTSLPIGVYTHGGGFVLGDVNGEDTLCRAVAEHTSSIVVSVDYRLAPEYKAPTQLQDTLKVFKWVKESASELGGDPNKIYTIGGSAGGTLALAAANKLVANPSDRSSIKGVVSIVPAVFHPDNVPEEYRPSYTAYEENGSNVPVIDATTMRQFLEYTGLEKDDQDYFVGPNEDNHKNFPPTYIVTCEFDPLRDDGVVLEQALKKAGVPVKRDHYEGLPHVFWAFPSLPEGQTFVVNLIGGVKWVIGQM